MKSNQLVVGYKGEIGRFILNGLLWKMPKAVNIYCIDRNETEDEIVERIQKSLYIFLCVPMLETLNWIEKYKPLLYGKIIVEQCSTKEWIYNSPITDELNIISMHILFRPSSTPVGNRTIGFVHNTYWSSANVILIQEMLEAKCIFYDDVKQHDKEMALVQGLTHRVLLTLGTLLKQTNSSTYISEKVMELVNRIEGGNKQLYTAMQGNKHLTHHLAEFEYDLTTFRADKHWNNNA